MDEIIFRQDPGLGSEMYMLTGDKLTIVEKSMGLKRETVIDLCDVSPTYEAVNRRLGRFYVIPMAFAILASAVTWKLWERGSEASAAALVVATMIPMFLWRTWKGFTPIRGARFRFRNGLIALEILQPRKSVLVYERFLLALRERIEAKGG